LHPFGARQLARQVHEHEPGVRQPGQRVGERVFLRLLEHDRVVDDGGGLLRHPIEQPAMVVRVEVGSAWYTASVPMKRSLKMSGATSAERSHAGGVTPAASKSALGRAFTSGRRLRATQPVSPSPARMRHAAHHIRLERRREPALQRSPRTRRRGRARTR
jgi:hypothetical protein